MYIPQNFCFVIIPQKKPPQSDIQNYLRRNYRTWKFVIIKLVSRQADAADRQNFGSVSFHMFNG